MYGLIIEGIADAIKNKYGEEKWEEVRVFTLTNLWDYHDTFLMARITVTISALILSSVISVVSQLCVCGVDRCLRWHCRCLGTGDLAVQWVSSGEQVSDR